MFVKEEIIKRMDVFDALCETHDVKRMHVFGSSVTGSFDFAKSDIDILVELNITDPLEKGEKLISLWDALESFFHRKVDLLTESSIKNPYLRHNINASKILVYDRESTQVFV
ncbi:MAG: nucleotidyltransferase domain-containing protein [Chitinophagaceae bacterium]